MTAPAPRPADPDASHPPPSGVRAAAEAVAEFIFRAPPHVTGMVDPLADDIEKIITPHLGAATGTGWTAERPTKPGWYWLLRSRGTVPSIVQVDFASPPNWITVVIENGNRYGIEGIKGEWSGPLAPPPEDQHGS